MSTTAPTAPTSPLCVAEYVRMSTDHQKYSIESQQELIKGYAASHGMTVVRSYMDAGRSGVTLRGRAGLRSLLAEVVSGTAPYKAVLVYDVSRWGRFQDADESAHYEFICRRAGIRIIYCAEQFAADATPMGNVLKSLKRAMAGEYSRELGVKVAAGKVRIGKLGFRIGGPAGFGLRRQLLTDGTVPSMILSERQRKSLQTDRVRLVPGPSEEIALIRQMYLHYIYLRKSERDIALELNADGKSFFGRPWSRNLVRTILSNEKYIGNNVVGRVSSRLYTRQVTKPESQWTRCEGAFEPVVPRHLFEAAEAVRRFNEKVYVTREDLLRGLRIVLKREGCLSSRVINQAPELPSANTVALRFGGLSCAYEAIGYVPPPRYGYHSAQRELARRCDVLVEELLQELRALEVPAWVTGMPNLLIDNRLNMHVMLCRWQQRHAHDGGWRVSYKRNAGVDFVLAARLARDSPTPMDYLLLPQHDLSGLPVFLRASHERLLAPYAYRGMEAAAKKLADSLRRQNSGKALSFRA